jgi:hypothetical protein
MVKALRIVGRAIGHWYDELFLLMFLNLTWFLLQLPIVTAPVATATMYVVAQKVVDKEYLELRTIWTDLRKMILPGLTWGFVNFVVVGVIVVNFIAYQNMFGTIWSVLRVAWGCIALAWISANLLYWPFWLVQRDRRMVTTYRNCYIFLLKNPGFGLSIVALSIVLIILCVLTTLPFVVLLISWLALIGVLAVNEGLKGYGEVLSS